MGDESNQVLDDHNATISSAIAPAPAITPFRKTTSDNAMISTAATITPMRVFTGDNTTVSAADDGSPTTEDNIPAVSAATIASEQEQQAADNGTPRRTVVQQMYPALSNLFGETFDPFHPDTQTSMRTLLSEIMHILDASREGLTVKDFGGHDISFVRVPRTSNDHSFNNSKSWVDETLKLSHGSKEGVFESAFRVSNHLIRFYRDSVIAAMKKQLRSRSQLSNTLQC